MAQWNPYYGVPNQNDSVYEEQNLSSQNYFGTPSVPYGSVPIQPMNYNPFYVPNYNFTQFGTNMSGNVFNVQELEAQQFASYTQNTNSRSASVYTATVDSKNAENDAATGSGADQNYGGSKLTATAAEFKPSTSNDSQISSQTYYRNDNENKTNKGAIRKNDSTPSTITSNEFKETNSPVPSTSDEVGRFSKSNKKPENRRLPYNRNNTFQNYTNEKYKNSKQDRNNYNKNVRRDENTTDEISDVKYNQRPNDYKAENKFNKYGNKDNNHKNYRKGENINSEANEIKYNQRQNEDRSENKYKYENKDNNRKHYRKEEDTNSEVNETKYNQRQNDPDNKYNKYDNKDNNFSRNPRREYNRDGRNNDYFEKSNRQNNYSHSKSDTKFNKYDNRDGHYSRNRDYLERNFDQNTISRDNRSSTNTYRNNRQDKPYENWRSGPSSSQQEKKNENFGKDKYDKDERPKSKSYEKDKKSNSRNKQLKLLPDDDISQRDRLTEQVNTGTLECLVCCERVRQSDKIWHCQKCFHIFHFRCIMRWGNTSKDAKGWRCPACQHVCNQIPSTCYCYCGKISDPPFAPAYTAHSCGEVCGSFGVKPGCVHNCNLLCHPGPCPKCEALISKKCNCGATTQMVICSADKILVCTSVCNKILNCGLHFCDKICHVGACNECLETIHQVCYCDKSDRTILCNAKQKDVKQYGCEQICDKLLKCGNHNCKEVCHPGDCPSCLKAPDQVKTCPCGKTKQETVRASCLDPISCCENVCGKRYPRCGTVPNPHFCKAECHEGPCPFCSLNSFVRCRCGHMSCEISCSKLNSRVDDARCEKKCPKKRSCGRHKCNQLCCIDIDHICPLPCNHTLTCGLHRCEKTCHKGRCQPCWRISFDELFCECGANVIYPPVPCGTKRPRCNLRCSRQHDCDHEALHSCHTLPECPLCSVLTTKWCFGKHEQRKTIPCYQKDFSCGLPCGKDLPCGRHKCQLPCHTGPCLKETHYCIQACSVIRETCGHPCGLPCHDSPCPESPCKESVKVICECGLRSSTRTCMDVAGEYQRIATSMLASKMADMQLGHSIDIADIVGTTARKQALKTLECNDECRLIERNRRLAFGLQIRNPDLSAKLTPRYSDFMRQWGKKDQSFCQMVHDKLTELVQLAKQSKQKSRSYSFPSMNREKRQFIHEYCEHFGCECAAYDQEPNRNVVATACKEKAWLPSCSLLELIQRQSGQRKVPGPILNRPLGVSKNSDSVSLKIPSTSSKPSTSSIVTQSTSFASTLQKPKSADTEVDYFNFPPNK